MDSKHPLASVTNWAAFFALLQGVATMFGLVIDIESAAAIAAGGTQAVLALLALWGRARADRPIRWRPQ